MKLFADFDLYKGVILASVLLLPAAGWWIHKNNQGIEAANRAIVDATKSRGLLEQIGELQRNIQVVESNRLLAKSATEDPKVYFERQIFRSDKNGSVGAGDISFPSTRDEPAFTGSTRQRATDHVVKVDFTKKGGKEVSLPRDFVFAMLFNCESGATSGSAAQLSIWKLRTLKIQNATAQAVYQQKKTPPAEFEDLWIIKDLEFARREPSKDTRK